MNDRLSCNHEHICTREKQIKAHRTSDLKTRTTVNYVFFSIAINFFCTFAIWFFL
ncbi:hypothetical protein T11_3786 [Trichinella zimbabwensis]|uniref:Uncharacterized protein n=1 Tax=Trichinella zimbabwensis TaxID=268475 RepID=A0A0V1G9A5_9BILA|nr:hypothetical protein T11_3786 [Trichinella zimbabwensis]